MIDSTTSYPDGFSVAQTTINDITVLSPSGSLTHETCPDMRMALEEAAITPRANLVLDCRQVKLMDSEALELLTEWHTRQESARGSLKLANLDEVCTDIMVVTRLIHVLNIQTSTKREDRPGDDDVLDTRDA